MFDQILVTIRFPDPLDPQRSLVAHGFSPKADRAIEEARSLYLVMKHLAAIPIAPYPTPKPSPSPDCDTCPIRPICHLAITDEDFPERYRKCTPVYHALQTMGLLSPSPAPQPPAPGQQGTRGTDPERIEAARSQKYRECLHDWEPVTVHNHGKWRCCKCGMTTEDDPHYLGKLSKQHPYWGPLRKVPELCPLPPGHDVLLCDTCGRYWHGLAIYDKHFCFDPQCHGTLDRQTDLSALYAAGGLLP